MKGIKKRRSQRKKPVASVKITDKMVVDATLLEITLNASFESLDLIEFSLQDTKKRLSRQAESYKKILGTLQELLLELSEENQDDKKNYIYEGTDELLDIKTEMKLDEVSWFLLVNSAIARFFGRMKPHYIAWEDYRLSLVTRSMSKKKTRLYKQERSKVFLFTINKMHESVKEISLANDNKQMVSDFVKKVEAKLDIQVNNDLV